MLYNYVLAFTSNFNFRILPDTDGFLVDISPTEANLPHFEVHLNVLFLQKMFKIYHCIEIIESHV